MSSFIDRLAYECKMRDRGDRIGQLSARFDRDAALADLAWAKSLRTDLSDETIDRMQQAFERDEDRYEHVTQDEIDSDDAGIPCRGEI